MLKENPIEFSDTSFSYNTITHVTELPWRLPHFSTPSASSVTKWCRISFGPKKEPTLTQNFKNGLIIWLKFHISSVIYSITHHPWIPYLANKIMKSYNFVAKWFDSLYNQKYAKMFCIFAKCTFDTDQYFENLITI